jgi:hypothetical protein
MSVFVGMYEVFFGDQTLAMVPACIAIPWRAFIDQI